MNRHFNKVSTQYWYTCSYGYLHTISDRVWKAVLYDW